MNNPPKVEYKNIITNRSNDGLKELLKFESFLESKKTLNIKRKVYNNIIKNYKISNNLVNWRLKSYSLSFIKFNSTIFSEMSL